MFVQLTKCVINHISRGSFEKLELKSLDYIYHFAVVIKRFSK